MVSLFLGIPDMPCYWNSKLTIVVINYAHRHIAVYNMKIVLLPLYSRIPLSPKHCYLLGLLSSTYFEMCQFCLCLPTDWTLYAGCSLANHLPTNTNVSICSPDLEPPVPYGIILHPTSWGYIQVSCLGCMISHFTFHCNKPFHNLNMAGPLCSILVFN